MIVGDVNGFRVVYVLVIRGESSCLAIAGIRKWLFLSDDMAARKEARRRGIAISGTLGCLVLAIDYDICSLEDANL